MRLHGGVVQGMGSAVMSERGIGDVTKPTHVHTCIARLVIYVFYMFYFRRSAKTVKQENGCTAGIEHFTIFLCTPLSMILWLLLYCALLRVLLLYLYAYALLFVLSYYCCFIFVLKIQTKLAILLRSM